MNKEVFILISFIIGMLCVKYLSSFDKHEKEPYVKMFAVSCWGGAWSIVVSFVLYTLLSKFGINDLKNSFGALFVIGPVEEFAKLLALFSSYFIFREEMNEATDGIIYMACVALGFSIIENYFYATRSVDSGYLIFLRLFIATPMHIAFSVFMGLAFYVWKKFNKPITIFIIPFAYASLAHGLYDLVIFNGFAFMLLLAVVQFAHSFSLSLLSYTTAQSPHRVSLSEFIGSYGGPSVEQGMECLSCGSTNPKETFLLQDVTIQKCDTCENYITTKKGVFVIFHFFASTFKKLGSQYSTALLSGKKYSTLYSNNYVSDEQKLAFFDLEKLNATIEKLNDSIIESMEGKWWMPKILSTPVEPVPVQQIDYEKVVVKTGAAVWRLCIYPFSMDNDKKIHIPEQQGPPWSWGAFLIPELWFLYHEIWGIFFLVIVFYSSLAFASMHEYINFFGQGMLVALLIMRLLAGRTGNIIYYFRHGKWPTKAYNSVK